MARPQGYTACLDNIHNQTSCCKEDKCGDIQHSCVSAAAGPFCGLRQGSRARTWTVCVLSIARMWAAAGEESQRSRTRTQTICVLSIKGRTDGRLPAHAGEGTQHTPILHGLLQRARTTSAAKRRPKTACVSCWCHVVSCLLQGQVMWAAAQAGEEDAAAFLCTQFEMTPGSADWQPAAAMAAVAQPPGCTQEAGGHGNWLSWLPSVCKDLTRGRTGHGLASV